VSFELNRDGLALMPGLVDPEQLDLVTLFLAQPSLRAGSRIFGNSRLDTWLKGGPVGAAVESILGGEARPVRAILFDKNPATNWSLGWHQDRTIAVRDSAPQHGFDHWTTKAGVTHVEPPFPIIEAMVTARIHLDAVDERTAPLLVSPGSHRLGRINESDIPAIVARCGTVACFADRGDVWLYRTAILHASEKSRSQAPRRVLQIDYSGEDLRGRLEWLGIG
jgi:hypothetical protein